MADDTYRTCSSCKNPIAFEATYFACSVSTCNRRRTALYFCSVPCWDAHLPEAHHREAWAEEKRAPTRAEAERDDALTPPLPRSATIPLPPIRDVTSARVPTVPPPPPPPPNPSPNPDPSPNPNPNPTSDLPADVLVVVSKLKAYVRAAAQMNTSDSVIDVLSDHLRRLCDAAARVAAREGRKTVMDRDFRVVLSDWND